MHHSSVSSFGMKWMCLKTLASKQATDENKNVGKFVARVRGSPKHIHFQNWVCSAFQYGTSIFEENFLGQAPISHQIMRVISKETYWGLQELMTSETIWIRKMELINDILLIICVMFLSVPVCWYWWYTLCTSRNQALALHSDSWWCLEMCSIIILYLDHSFPNTSTHKVFRSTHWIPCNFGTIHIILVVVWGVIV